MTYRCDVCGRFRKTKTLHGIAGEGEERWIECDWCLSPSDREFYGVKDPVSREVDVFS